jgi:signal transduction histidine kinase
MNAPLPVRTERERLAVLDAYGILDTPTERAFDDIVALVGQLLQVPIVAVNLLAEGRQWFKSEIGLGTREMPLDDSICKFALLQQDRMVVPDTRLDDRFACNPLVTGAPGLRFYAGELLKTSDGVALGTLCALDLEPRPQGLTAQQQALLGTMARQVMSLIELHKAVRVQHALLQQQKAIEEALRQADQKKDEFLAMLAHELRNPLAPITSAAAILSGHAVDAGTVRRTSAIIARQAKHMTGLIDDLLDVSRVTRGRVDLTTTELDMKDIIADAIEQVRPLVEKHRHHLLVQLAPLPALVLGDRKRLVQVMTNLLSNAAKYTPNGGAIEVQLEADGDGLAITVRDNGIGMTPGLIADAFDLFSQGKRGLDRSQGGLGIGLALVKSLLQLHGGTVGVHSDGPDLGTCFVVRLPAPARDAAGIQAAIPAAAGRGPVPLRIGIVDDNEDAAATLCMFLQAFGHEMAIAHSARQALAQFPGFGPDVCLLDIGLPEMDGFDLARALRAGSATGGAVLIAITGYAQEKDREEARGAGFDELFAKPVDLAALNTLLAQVGQHRRDPAR